jgi:flavin reductase (DIM6/NTAB) family NADH-FMN oxidoreductase RutF
MIMSDLGDASSHSNLSSISRAGGCELLASVMPPRPIAWVVTRAADGIERGVVNGAPFSSLNIVSPDSGWLRSASDGEGKQTKRLTARSKHQYSPRGS